MNCALDLWHNGVLAKYKVELIGATPEAIDKAEDRGKFKLAMEKIGLFCPKSFVAHTMEQALAEFSAGEVLQPVARQGQARLQPARIERARLFPGAHGLVRAPDAEQQPAEIGAQAGVARIGADQLFEAADAVGRAALDGVEPGEVDRGHEQSRRELQRAFEVGPDAGGIAEREFRAAAQVQHDGMIRGAHRDGIERAQRLGRPAGTELQAGEQQAVATAPDLLQVTPPVGARMIPPELPAGLERGTKLMMPLMVVSLIWSNDVQVELLRFVQLPLDDTLMPAARIRASAWACESLAAKSGLAQSGAYSSPVTVPSSSSVASANASGDKRSVSAKAVPVKNHFFDWLSIFMGPP